MKTYCIIIHLMNNGRAELTYQTDLEPIRGICDFEMKEGESSKTFHIKTYYRRTRADGMVFIYAREIPLEDL